MNKSINFFNFYNHNFIRLAVAVPEVRVADPKFNVIQTISLMRQAAEQKALLVVFPELGLSAYSCEDLFQQQALLDGCLDGLSNFLAASREISLVAVVGLPLQVDNLLFNCAAVIYRGRILGVIPKTYLPNYREFYEMRQFTPGDEVCRDKVDLCSQRDVPFGTRLLFQIEDQPLLTFFIEICEDLWVPVPPSSYAALAGATVLINLSASNMTVGKEEYRQQLVTNQSGRCLSAYVYVSAGFGESTTDLAWDGHGIISENGALVAETKRFLYRPQLVTTDIDLDRLTQDRMRQNSFSQAIQRHREKIKDFRTVRFSVNLPIEENAPLERIYERFPYVSSDPGKRDQRCHEVYQIQVQGLLKRLKAACFDKVLIGISGGLDSTHALLVCARVMDIMGLPRNHILGYTMPGFATSARTQNQARRLMETVGCQVNEIDIRPSCLQMLKDINHPFAAGKPVFDITFENVQAGERTSHLFRLANLHGGLVVGTSDLSELALGWCTYGVGDHMAHYHVNASVPKTLIQYLIRWVAETGQLGPDVSSVLQEVLETDISPELLPGESRDQPAQRSEDIIGPFELQDFNLYYTLRFGYRPTKIAFLAWCAWNNRNQGAWPNIPEAKRHQYEIGEIKRWLDVFLERFFKQSQYKRSCMPNAPKVGSGGSLSPRGDYRAPSDSEATAWLAQVEQIPDKPAGIRLQAGDALIVVDVQNDFLPGGSLAVPRGDEVLSILNRAIGKMQSAGRPVFATRDWHPPGHCSFKAQGGPWPPHCVAGTSGAAFAEALKLPLDAKIISKAATSGEDAYSGFQGTDLDPLLRARKVRRLFIGGLATDYCVLNTVKDALQLGYRVFLLRDAVRAVDVRPGDGERALAGMEQLGAVLIESGDLT